MSLASSVGCAGDEDPVLSIELKMIVCPVVVGGGKRSFPGGVRLELELLEEHRSGSGVLALRYGVRRDAGGLASDVQSQW